MPSARISESEYKWLFENYKDQIFHESSQIQQTSNAFLLALSFLITGFFFLFGITTGTANLHYLESLLSVVGLVVSLLWYYALFRVHTAQKHFTKSILELEGRSPFRNPYVRRMSRIYRLREERLENSTTPMAFTKIWKVLCLLFIAFWSTAFLLAASWL